MQCNDGLPSGVGEMDNCRKHKYAETRSSKHHGFTLVEMLVVIAIISILAAMLMPALTSSLHIARDTACGNNLRQIGIALAHYSTDFYGYYPALDDPAVQYWPKKLAPYVSRGVEYPPYSNLFFCPSESNHHPNIIDYGGNFRSAISNPAVRISRYVSPSKVIAVADARELIGDEYVGTWLMNDPGWWLSGYGPYPTRHNWSMNFLFIDIHVASMVVLPPFSEFWSLMPDRNVTNP